MPTLVGVRAADAAVVAADRTLVRDGRIASRDRERVLGGDDWALAVAGDDVDAVRDRVDVAVREYRTDRGRVPGIEPLSRLAGEVATALGSDLLVAARDDAGEARVAAVRADGSRLVDSPVALGTGTELALGRLEAADLAVDRDAAADLARDAVRGASERDPATGTEVDVRTVSDRA